MAMGHEGSPSADVRVATGGVKVDGSRARVRRARARREKKEGWGGLCVVLFVNSKCESSSCVSWRVLCCVVLSSCVSWCVSGSCRVSMKERKSFTSGASYTPERQDHTTRKATAYLGYAEVQPRLRVPAKRTDMLDVEEWYSCVGKRRRRSDFPPP